MAHGYRLVQWTRYKVAFDIVLMLGVLVFIAAFVAAALLGQPPGRHLSEVQLLIRATGACVFAVLTFILVIGPMARLTPRFLPLLYNRRHLGVVCFLLAFIHARLVLLWYHGFSDLNPFVSLLVSNPRYDSIQGFPFESLGLAALLILFVLAATSHDFWNTNLGPRLWKALHMSVYWAYALLVGHIMLGAVQGQKGAIYALGVGASAALVVALHLYAGRREVRRDRASLQASDDIWLSAGPALDIPDQRARIVTPEAGERIAVFRDGDKIYAVSNVCRHQGGPLGEGRIVDGCVTCPWHGFQYRPGDGRAPDPYDERIATYRTRVVAGVAYVYSEPEAPGVETAPSLIGAPA